MMATMAAAAPTEKRAPTPLDVKLELVGNSEVKATVTNNGKNNLKIMKTGTLLDTAAVEKVEVLSGGEHQHLLYDVYLQLLTTWQRSVLPLMVSGS